MDEIGKIRDVEKEVAGSIEKAKNDAEDKIDKIIAGRDVVFQKKINRVEKEADAKKEEMVKDAKAQSGKIVKKAESEVKKIRSANVDKAVGIVMEEFKG